MTIANHRQTAVTSINHLTATQPTLVVLVGPTAVGKTDLSLELAQRMQCSIVSADSRQLYADLPIGTAAPTAQQLQTVQHYFVGTLQLTDYYSAARYADDALDLLQNQLFKDGNTALLTGGSMMYIDALCNGIDDIPTVDDDTRTMMQERLQLIGLEGLQQELRMLDPKYYDIVDLKNHKRVVHALEICYMTGRPFSSFRTNTKVKRPFNIIKIGLNRDRSELFDRINRRADIMIQEGMLEEARRVYPYRELNSLNTVGYKELFAHFDGQCTLSEAITKIQRNTRVYAKKQLTWFKRDEEIKWFHPNEKEAIFTYLSQHLQ